MEIANMMRKRKRFLNLLFAVAGAEVKRYCKDLSYKMANKLATLNFYFSLILRPVSFNKINVRLVNVKQSEKDVKQPTNIRVANDT